MTAQPPEDPLIALWQTAPAPKTHNLAKDLERLDQLHRRSRRSIVAILWCVAILLVFEEATGRLASHGLLSMLWIVGVVIGLGRHRRTQCTRLDALTSDTVSLLRLMLAQARGDLFLARCLYAGAPAGALVGYLVMRIVDRTNPLPAVANAPNLHAVQTLAGIAVLLIMVATGAMLSRSRVLQVKSLAAQLKSIADEA